jgi:hypothetical protein
VIRFFAFHNQATGINDQFYISCLNESLHTEVACDRATFLFSASRLPTPLSSAEPGPPNCLRTSPAFSALCQQCLASCNTINIQWWQTGGWFDEGDIFRPETAHFTSNVWIDKSNYCDHKSRNYEFSHVTYGTVRFQKAGWSVIITSFYLQNTCLVVSPYFFKRKSHKGQCRQLYEHIGSRAVNF